jgi:hypothetical protein
MISMHARRALRHSTCNQNDADSGKARLHRCASPPCDHQEINDNKIHEGLSLVEHPPIVWSPNRQDNIYTRAHTRTQEIQHG